MMSFMTFVVMLVLAGDVIGYFLAWCSLLPFCICIGFITLIFFRRDLHTVSFVADYCSIYF